MTVDNIIKLAQAVKDGKQLEQREFGTGRWLPWTCPDKDTRWTMCKDSEIRIKPEPKKRLIKVEELPFPCLVRQFDDGDKYIVTQYTIVDSAQRIEFDDSRFEIRYLAKNKVEWSADGKSWHSFEVEEN